MLNFAYVGLFFTLYAGMMLLLKIKKAGLRDDLKPFLNKDRGALINRAHHQWYRYLRMAAMRQQAESKFLTTLNKIAKLMNHRAHKSRGLSTACWMVFGGALGWQMGMWVENLFVALILALVGLSLPFFYLQNIIRAYDRDLNEKLLIVLSSLQGEYIKPHTPFIRAVTLVLPTIPDPLYQPFKQYADTINHFHPDSPIEALKVLEQAVDNYFFTEYICLAMLAEEGEHGLKATMSSIPDEYQSYLETNRAYSYKVAHYNQNFQMTLLTFPMMVGFLKVASEEYFHILVHHPLGKITLAGLTLLYIGAAIVFNHLNVDVKLEL